MSGKRLDGKVAIVTGGSGGIGKGICLRLAEEGAKIIIFVDSNIVGANEVASEIKQAGGTAIGMKVNITKSADVENAVKEILSKFGRIDILVNCAGISIPSKLVDLPEEQWDKMNAINLKGVFLCCKAVIPNMKERKSGRIINIGSLMGQRGTPFAVPYSTTKAGVVGFTQGLATELGPRNITVNTVSPGFIESPLVDKDASQAVQDTMLKRIPLRRMGTVLDVANAVLFFASEESSYITGQCLSVSGGLDVSAGIM